MFKDRLHELEISFPPRYGATLHHTTNTYNTKLRPDVPAVISAPLVAAVGWTGMTFMIFINLKDAAFSFVPTHFKKINKKS